MKRSSTPVRYFPPRAWPWGSSSMAGVIFRQTRKMILGGYIILLESGFRQNI